MKRTKTVKTPNLDKMIAVKDRSEEVQAFLDWLVDDSDYDLMLDEVRMTGERARENIMAAYFGINLAEAERERMALLGDIRQDHKVEAAIQKRGM